VGGRESGEGTGGVVGAGVLDAVGVVGLSGPEGGTVEDGVAAGEWVGVAGEWGAGFGGDGAGQAGVGGERGLGGGAPGAEKRGELAIRGGCAEAGAVWMGSSVATGVESAEK
jgi:hypothetical protein